MNPLILLSTFVLGIFGSLHCLGMCGPLALAIPFPAQGKSKINRIAVYYLAKATAYAGLGALIGGLGKVIMLMEWQQALSVAAGIFILLMALLPALKNRAGGGFIFRKKMALLYTRLQANPRVYYFFLLGFLNGLLPCGLVYTALAAAALAGSTGGGSAAMLLFGLGTTPALVLLILFKHKMNVALRRRLLPASAFLSAAIGILLILRGLNLGLPYLSPHVEKSGISQCCHK